MNVLVTVGVPTYHRAATLERTLLSICKQSYENLEIIVSNNCPDDPDTERVVRSFLNRDSRIRYFVQEKNIGPTRNFAFLLSKASGVYFLWVADDDDIPLDYVENTTRFLNEHPDYALVGYQSNFYYQGEQVAEGTRINITGESEALRVFNVYRTMYDNSIYYGVARRSVLDNLQLINVMGSDWLWVSGIALQGKISMLKGGFISRNAKGTSRSYCSYASILQVPQIQAWFPYLTIALNGFYDVLWRQEIYRKRLCLINRVLLALSILVYVIIERCFCLKIKYLFLSIWKRVKLIENKVARIF